MMNKLMYVSIFDDSESNSYIDQAFTMLKINLQKIQVDKLESFLATYKSKSIVLVARDKQQIQIDSLLDDYPSIIVLIASANPQTEEHIRIVNLSIPFDIYEFKNALRRCQNLFIHHHSHNSVFDTLIGNSEPIQKVKDMIQQVSASDSNILLLGQSGTGKNVIASCIHKLSQRKENLFVPLNCGAIPSELIESELFGHEKGAFTGAISRRPGRFEIAHHGTLFLDEIGDMPLHMQVKLLRVLQERIIERVGSTTSIEVDVRLISATNRNLEDMVKNQQFREDLYYRLNVIPIYVPTLAERASDVPLLIEYHLNKIYKRFPHHAEFSDDAINTMVNYEWPGNIRELANFIERMVVLYQDKTITAADINQQLIRSHSKSSLPLGLDAAGFNLNDYLSDVEQQMIKLALEKSNGMINSAAEYLNLGKTALTEKIKKYKLAFIE